MFSLLEEARQMEEAKKAVSATDCAQGSWHGRQAAVLACHAGPVASMGLCCCGDGFLVSLLSLLVFLWVDLGFLQASADSPRRDMFTPANSPDRLFMGTGELVHLIYLILRFA